MNDSPAKMPLADDAKSETPRAGSFKPGQSGNPKGRPKGSRNKTTLAVEALIEGEAEEIMRKLIEKAKEGNSTALRLCLDRLVPPRRERSVAFDMDEIKTAADADKASSSVLAAVAEGTLTPDEATKVMALITAHINIVEVSELEAKWMRCRTGCKSNEAPPPIRPLKPFNRLLAAKHSSDQAAIDLALARQIREDLKRVDHLDYGKLPDRYEPSVR